MDLGVVEIRSYLLKPGVTEKFIAYFEEHFVFSQEDVGIRVLGQFEVIGEPRRFAWIRGFKDMEARRQGLQGFYLGPVWERYKSAANDMMLEWHHVHLLRPLAGSGDLASGYGAAEVAADLAGGRLPSETGLVAVDHYSTKPGCRDAFADVLERHLLPQAKAHGARILGCFVAEMAENDFPQLPVIQDENLVVVVSLHADGRDSGQRLDGTLEASPWPVELGREARILLEREPQTVLLKPTPRSPIRHR